MKAKPKLRRYITLSITAIILVMIVAYSFLIYYSLFSSIEEAASYDLRLKARDYEQSYREDTTTPLPESKYLTGYLGTNEIPDWFKRRYNAETVASGKLLAGETVDPQIHDGKKFLFLAMAHNLYDQRRLYLIETYTEDDEIPGTFTNIDRTLTITLGLGIGFILLVGFTLRYFFNRISTPINALSDWASSLNRTKLEQPHPDFKFQEINQLADLIQNAVGDSHQALVREHHFLRNASHELRTPIAVIQTNLDLLERLKADSGEKEETPHLRIRRAVDDMHRLTETLLWLSRKEDSMPPAESISIKTMVEELVLINRYLLDGKDVDLDLDLEETKTTLPKVALGIVLGNLIRNAFQYTDRGKVQIRVKQMAVSITNSGQTHGKSSPTSNDHGFGLGLILVDQICRRLKLIYDNKSIPGGYETTLKFSHTIDHMD